MNDNIDTTHIIGEAKYMGLVLREIPELLDEEDSTNCRFKNNVSSKIVASKKKGLVTYDKTTCVYDRYERTESMLIMKILAKDLMTKYSVKTTMSQDEKGIYIDVKVDEKFFVSKETKANIIKIRSKQW